MILIIGLSLWSLYGLLGQQQTLFQSVFVISCSFERNFRVNRKCGFKRGGVLDFLEKRVGYLKGGTLRII